MLSNMAAAKVLVSLALWSSILCCAVLAQEDPEPIDVLHQALLDVVDPAIDELKANFTALVKISNQMLSWQQQMFMEKTRIEGDSGLALVRNIYSGTKPWATNTWSRANGQAAIHDHSNNIRTVGMGEVVAVLNGVLFKTRHNDYRLNQPSTTTKEYGAYEPISFPEVPPEVVAKPTVAEQVLEMREFFRAFALQDTSIRDYRPYFKPVLSYMEGAWTITGDLVDEPFFSDRHSINADTWFELQQSVMYNTWSGRKDEGENIATLPNKIYDVNEDGTPKIAQWNYKILCHMIEDIEVPLNRMRVVDDLHLMMRSYKSQEELAETRSARFQLHHDMPDDENFNGVWYDEEKIGMENFLEELMSQVPGADNYPGNIEDAEIDEAPVKRPDGSPLNAARYHRYYQYGSRDASGFERSPRGFADANLFVAYNNQTDNIAPVLETHCTGKRNNRYCESREVRATYAIPLEIIYLTPLHAWNPYNIRYYEQRGVPEAGGRDGAVNSTTRAFNGSSPNVYYRVPAEFFEGGEQFGDLADTVAESVYVLDGSGKVRKTVASGVRIFLPHIPGVGTVRTRYPIFSVHQEGNPIYKELSALKDLVRYGARYPHLYNSPLGGFSTAGSNSKERFTFMTGNGFGQHTHTFELTREEIRHMITNAGSGYTVSVQTSVTSSHSHTLFLKSKAHQGTIGLFIYQCDPERGFTGKILCRDGHPERVDCIGCPDDLLSIE